MGFAWRIFFGPLNENIALINVVGRQILGLIGQFYLTDIMIHKLIMIFYWKHFCYVDENFFANFVFLINLGFSFGIQFSRYWMGVIDSEYEILSNKFIPNQIQMFWPVFISISKSNIFLNFDHTHFQFKLI